jgi:hypothetical protein
MLHSQLLIALAPQLLLRLPLLLCIKAICAMMLKDIVL